MATAFSGITGEEKYGMANIVYAAVKESVENCYSLQRVADEFSYGDLGEAFVLCFQKGLQEYEMMMDMAEHMEGEE